MNAQELVERLNEMTANFVEFSQTSNNNMHRRLYFNRAELSRAAASRLSEMEAENARLRELHRVSFMQMLAVLRQCSDRLEIFNSSFSDIDPLSDTIVQYRSDANDSFVLERRAALEHQQKGEGL